jgi:hypothetical protein
MARETRRRRRVMRLLLLGAALSCASITASTPALADDARYQNVLVGERALGLAGAFTALASDSSATYYNPAGLVRIRASSFTLQSSVYGFVREVVEGGSNLGLGAAREDVAVNSFNVVPTTLAIVKELSPGKKDGSWRQKIAFSIYLVDSLNTTRRSTLEDVAVTMRGQTLAAADYNELEHDKDATMLVGGSYAISLGPRISLGATVYLAYRAFSRYLNLTAASSGGARFLRTIASVEATHLSLLAAVGLQLRPLAGLALGLTIYSPNVRIYDGADVSVEWARTKPNNAITSDNREGVAVRSPQPLRVTLGAAYELPRRFAVAADVSLYLPRASYRDVDDDVIGRDHAVNFTVNVNLGVEYYPLKMLPLRAGFFTNLSRDDGFDLQKDSHGGFDLFGLTASVGLEMEQISFNVGAMLQLGSGATETYDPSGDVEGGVARQALFIMVSGSYNF